VAQAYVADTIKAKDRARALGWLSAATSAGVMVGPIVGSLAARFGQEAPGFVAATLCVVNALFAWRWLPESRKPGVSAAVRKPAWHAVWQVIRRPSDEISRLILIYAVGMLAFSALQSVLALYLDAEFGVDEHTIGWYYAYVGALSLVMRSLLLGPIVDRIGETRAMRLGTMVMVAGLALYPVPGSIWMLALVMPLVPIGTALLFPSTTALMSRRADRDELGTVMGAAQTFGAIARVVAPIIGTLAFGFHHDLPFLVAGTIVAFVGVLAFRVSAIRYTDTPTAGTPTA
jgi:MFS family permease